MWDRYTAFITLEGKCSSVSVCIHLCNRFNRFSKFIAFFFHTCNDLLTTTASCGVAIFILFIQQASECISICFTQTHERICNWQNVYAYTKEKKIRFFPSSSFLKPRVYPVLCFIFHFHLFVKSIGWIWETYWEINDSGRW